MDPEEPLEETTERISRRTALGRIGAGAAIAWSAPILTSLRTPAYAQQYECVGGVGVGCAVGGDDCFGQVACGAVAGVCSCVRTTEGTCFCHAFSLCAGLVHCTSSAECPAGSACAFSCCDTSGLAGFCLPPCADGEGAVRGAGTSGG